MEKQDLELIEQLMDRDPELKQYVEKHRDYEKQFRSDKPTFTGETTPEDRALVITATFS